MVVYPGPCNTYSAESSRREIRREQTKEERESAGGNNLGMMARHLDYWPRKRSILGHRPHSATAVDAPSENSLRPGSNCDCSIPRPAARVVRNALPPTHDTGEVLSADSRRAAA